MTDHLWLGVEIGINRVAAVLADGNGRVRAQASQHFAHCQALDGAVARDNQLAWREQSLLAIRSCIAGREPGEIRAVGICGAAPAVLLLDARGEPVGQALRARQTQTGPYVEEAERVLDTVLLGDEFSPRLLWLRETYPAMFARTARLVSPCGYLILLLTGRATIDSYSAHHWGGLMDGARARWSESAATALDFRLDVLPEIIRPTSVAGPVTSAAASLTGLAPGTPVIGATDTLARFLGYGADRASDMLIHYGSDWTAIALTTNLASLFAAQPPEGETVPWRVTAYAADAGRYLEQLRVAMFRGRTYEQLDAMAASVPPGARGVCILPGARATDASLRSTMAAVVGFGLEHKAADLWRAALESLGYLVAEGVECSTPASARAFATGGGARSATWRAIVTDVTNMEQWYEPNVMAAGGAALLAALAVQDISSIDSISRKWFDTTPATISKPSPRRVAAYKRQRRGWQAFERALSLPPKRASSA